MPKAKNTVVRKHRVKRVLQKAKGFFGRKKNLYSVAKQNVIRAGMYALAHRRKKKGDFSRLWNVRINAALQSVEGDLSYSRFINLLKKSNVRLNRKVLAYFASNDIKLFSDVVREVSKN